jgi:PKD repeat protein
VSAPQAQVGAKLTMQAVFVAADGTISTNGISQVAWAFGDDGTASGLSASHSWSAAGHYTVTASVRLTNGSTLAAQTTIQVIGQSPPSAELTLNPRTGGAPLAVTADASGSRAGTAPIASYQFDFGDSTTAAASSAAIVKHTYTANGTYNVQVTVKDMAGNSSVAYATVTVQAAGTTNQGKPTAALTVSPNSGEAALKVTANATGSKPGGAAISQYVFDFGDGTAAVTSTGGSTTHTFNRGGNYTVTVTVTDTAGQSDTVTAPVSVSAGIIPSLHVTTGGAGSLTITADGSGSTSSTPMRFQFDFGDGTTAGPSSESTVQHTYGAAGTYKVVMTVTDTAGSMSDYGTATVTVPSGGCTLDPGMSTNTTSGPAPLAVTVTMSEPCDPGPVTYEYDFGDGTKPTTTATSQSHTYSTPGTYYITVTTTAGSQAARRVATITVTSAATPAKPRITANPPTAFSYVWITLDASGTIPGSTPITDYSWTFFNMDQGTYTRDTGTTPTTQFENQASGGIGDWTMTVTVTDGTGSHSASTTVTIIGGMTSGP